MPSLQEENAQPGHRARVHVETVAGALGAVFPPTHGETGIIATGLLTFDHMTDEFNKTHAQVDATFFRTNKDGTITKAEFTAGAMAMFDRADSNKDGYVTADEMKAGRQAMRAAWKDRKASAQN